MNEYHKPQMISGLHEDINKTRKLFGPKTRANIKTAIVSKLTEIVLNLTLRVRSSENPETLFEADSDDPRSLFNLTSTLVNEFKF
jgi:hypothetical protein